MKVGAAVAGTVDAVGSATVPAGSGAVVEVAVASPIEYPVGMGVCDGATGGETVGEASSVAEAKGVTGGVGGGVVLGTVNAVVTSGVEVSVANSSLACRHPTIRSEIQMRITDGAM